MSLTDCLAGETHESPASVLALIRHMPEGAAYTARVSAEEELKARQRKAAGEPEPEAPEDDEDTRLQKLVLSYRHWRTPEHLIAGLTNRLTTIASVFASPSKDSEREKFHREWTATFPAISPLPTEVGTNDNADPAEDGDGSRLFKGMRNLGI